MEDEMTTEEKKQAVLDQMAILPLDNWVRTLDYATQWVYIQDINEVRFCFHPPTFSDGTPYLIVEYAVNNNPAFSANPVFRLTCFDAEDKRGLMKALWERLVAHETEREKKTEQIAIDIIYNAIKSNKK